MQEMLRLGIDTGGTFTDAVLLNDAGDVIASAKALTTKWDLTVGIGQAIEAILDAGDSGPIAAERLSLVSISTTLATNAVVEAHSQPICLIMIGEKETVLDRAGLRDVLGGDPAVFIAGGHDSLGEETAPLDLAAVKATIAEHEGRVSAFAVSGQFGTRNPDHERRVRDCILEACAKPVTCGHELSANLDMPRRALTAVLNARLIPMIADLIEAVTSLMGARGIKAPLMVVKGDGSLISAETARLRPVETVLSGPAASVVGANHMTGGDDLIVVDMGGTTTDIALLRNGRPDIDPSGANVSGWRTMVQAIAVHTVGLGGDSEIRLNDEKELVAGPRRAVPISLLAHSHPDTVEILRSQAERRYSKTYDGRFAIRQRSLTEGSARLSASEKRLWDKLDAGPVSLEILFAERAPEQPLSRLVDRGLVAISAFTPSDAAHVLGLHGSWNKEAAILAASIWARQERRTGQEIAESAEDFSQMVFDLIIAQAGEALTLAMLEADGLKVTSKPGPIARHMIRSAFTKPAATAKPPILNLGVRFSMPIAAIGAPAATYYPSFGASTGNEVVLPEFGHVSNAVGAVAGGVMQTVLIHISAPSEHVFRVHMPDALRDFGSFEDATENAEQAAHKLAWEQAIAAGAETVHVAINREDKIAPQPGGYDLFIESTVTAVATGRPSLMHQ